MQLKLSVGDEVLKIDVQPTDTFQDITERLYSLGNVKVDLKQLRSTNNDKPFDMTTNVMEYFNKTSKVKMTSDNQTRRDNTLETPKSSSKLPCRLCGETLSSAPSFLFDAPSGEHEVTLAEKVNTALPLHVTKKDPHSKQVCEKCVGFLDKTYDFMRMVLAAQNTLENRLKKVEHMCQLRRDERCPLCNSGHLKSVCRRPSQNPPAVSRKSGVTVQVPKPSASNKWGSKRSLTDDDESSQTEFYMNDEVVTGYWEPPKPSGSSSSGSLNNLSGSGRKYKKKIKTEDDHDWTIDEEYVPVSRRGRPKGRRNKPKIISIVQKTCVLCEWTGSDLDMLAHSVNMHCQPDLDYFPCPMCRTTHPNEMELENHIEDHIAGLRK